MRDFVKINFIKITDFMTFLVFERDGAIPFHIQLHDSPPNGWSIWQDNGIPYITNPQTKKAPLQGQSLPFTLLSSPDSRVLSL
jgi:hypothetical protein